MTHETEVLAQFYAAINRNDVPAIAQHFDPQVVRVEPPGFPTAGTYRGVAQVQAHVAQGRATWAEGTCEPERFFVKGDKVVVYLHVRVRLNGTTDWIDVPFADGFVFRAGRIAHYASFAERVEAMKWADLDAGLDET